ncbi:glutamate-1-semialdehyde 2,1-aminomutase [Catenuloplanes atrovinosus]|uniref:Glutamate-1-semialdehyde 2,1-aminomutase n=1 Tax=Catenuloplanes atrovinosus TaxID=137266 RepID=A0AAE3YYT8_9ACTN|nr:glutamate-1-semialdehyde 2,1-aminomutase [Catenuloplanes atrovinosus]MDR7281110.1 glutamate-1-semialdehyde 2,1-aminomutase [Catenuloplanes atrovinosus]
MRFDVSRQLRERAHAMIPGGAHTYAKGDDQYPEDAPGFIVRGAGCHVRDVDGNDFIEYGMGLRAVTLGHGYAPVVSAVAAALPLGSNFTRPAAIEVEAAERLLATVGRHDGAMVKFAKHGSDATTAAVKLARAHTGRDMVAICTDHPFFSTDDWFIGATAMPGGVPAAVRGLTAGFHYNDLDSVAAVFTDNPGRIAALVMEAETTTSPAPGFLAAVRRLCDEHGALLVIDETLTGFRWHNRGAQEVHEVTGDLAVYGKAMGNGFAISALVGRPDVMELGGLRHDRERVFLLSTTHGAETHALAAAMAVMETYAQEPVVETLYRQGARLAAGVTAAAERHGVGDYFGVLGRDCNLIYYTKDAAGERSQPFRTLFLQELIAGGVIAPSFSVSYAHTDADVDRTIEVVDAALGVYAKALEAGGVEGFLRGRPVAPVFRRFN